MTRRHPRQWELIFRHVVDQHWYILADCLGVYGLHILDHGQAIADHVRNGIQQALKVFFETLLSLQIIFFQISESINARILVCHRRAEKGFEITIRSMKITYRSWESTQVINGLSKFIKGLIQHICTVIQSVLFVRIQILVGKETRNIKPSVHDCSDGLIDRKLKKIMEGC
ncbi:hypothetical protein CsSME_00008932 [Camellia sinensis var. sinensis]